MGDGFRNLVPFLWRSVLGGTVVMVPGVLGYLAGNLWLFPSLGPSVYLIVAFPGLKTARAYNVFAGHLLAVACGYFAAAAMGVSGTPSAIPSHHLLAPHVAAAGLAMFLVILLQLLAGATHPPAASTALLITLGAFSPTWQDCLLLVAGITIVTVTGEVARRFMIRAEGNVTKP